MKRGAANPKTGDELSFGGGLPSLKPRIVCTLHPLEIMRCLKMETPTLPLAVWRLSSYHR